MEHLVNGMKGAKIFFVKDISFKFYLGGGFNHLLFSALLGEMIQFESYFSDGLKPPTSHTVDGGNLAPVDR